MKHIVSFLEKHPELGVAPKLSPNSILNDKQVAAVIDYYKNEENRPIISNHVESNSEFEITEEQIADQENDALKISTAELNPNIKVVGQIDLDALNQSTRPQKKTKEEKRKERDEKEMLRKEQRLQMKETIIKEVHKTVYGSEKEGTLNKKLDRIRQEYYQQINDSIACEIVNESDENKFPTNNNIRLFALTRELNIGIQHIISFLKNHPELGEVPKLTRNSKLNKAQAVAVIDFFKEEQSTIGINPANLLFEQGYVTINYKNNLYTLKEKQFSNDLNKIKKDRSIFNNNIVELIIENKNKLFSFKDNILHEKLIITAKELLDKKRKERKEKREKQKEQQNGDVHITTNFMSFTFDDGSVIYNYNNTKFSCLDYKSLKDYNILTKIASQNPFCKKSLQQQLRITLNLKSKTFTWNNDFDIHDYLNICWGKYAEKDINRKLRVNSSEYNYESEQEQRAYCKIENIEFFDRYYKIWIVKNGLKVNNIQPLIITDPNSQECLQFVSKYFENRIPNDVMIVFTNKKVEQLINGFKLQKYVETLKKNKEIPSDWWNTADNREIKTLENYRKIPRSFVNKEVSFKNVYIDYLTSYQGEKPLLIAYEIFNGQEEKCFVFNVSIDDKRSAIIYENININRATNVFIIDKQDYEESMNLIFNYFTDEDLSRKRMSIRTSQNPPEKFKAIEIKTINHDNLNIWINKLNELLVPVSQQITDKSPEHIKFVSGLNIKSGNTERVNTKETITVTNLHDELKEKLYFQLSQKYGADNVGTEIHIGKKKIDLVVRNKNSYDIYEIKTDQDVRTCIREAIGQIIDYAYFECKDKVGKMTIVGPTQISQEASEYLENIRIKHDLPIYYESVN